MNLDEVQRNKVAEWVDGGLKLSEIQSKISAEFGISMTYMEMRFLLDDLALKPKDIPAPPPVAPPPPQPGNPTSPGTQPPGEPPLGAGEETEGFEEEYPQPSGNVSVSVDQVTKPGAMVSGSVTFSDNQTAYWYLDQMGRLGLAAKAKGYKPSQEDLMEFQVLLHNELAKQGY